MQSAPVVRDDRLNGVVWYHMIYGIWYLVYGIWYLVYVYRSITAVFGYLDWRERRDDSLDYSFMERH